MKGSIRWRDGAWRIQVSGTDPVTGKRIQPQRTVKAPNNRNGRREAESELAKFIVEIEGRKAALRTGLTVAQVLERYVVARSPDWSPGSPVETRRRIAQHITPYIGDIRVDRLRPIDVQQLVERWRAAGLTPRRIFDVLHAGLEWAERHELIDRNPAARIDKPMPRRAEVDPPSAADVMRLIATANEEPELALFVRLAALTGARRGQLIALRWRDIDLDAGTIRWTRALAKVPGGVEVKGTKTGARWSISIDPVTIGALRGHRRRAAERALAAGTSLVPDAYVFTTDPVGRTAWHPDGATQRFARIRTKLGLSGVRLHDLRHWMATEGVGDGDVEIVADRGGWANTSTLLDIYSHYRQPRDVDLARALADLLDGE